MKKNEKNEKKKIRQKDRQNVKRLPKNIAKGYELYPALNHDKVYKIYIYIHTLTQNVIKMKNIFYRSISSKILEGHFAASASASSCSSLSSICSLFSYSHKNINYL